MTVDRFGRVAEVRRPAALPLVFPTGPATTAQLVNAVDALLAATAAAVRQWPYDAPVRPPIAFNVTIAYSWSDEPSLVSQDGSPAAARLRARTPPRPALPPPPDDPVWADGAIHVGGDVGTPSKTRHVSPVYPPAARDAHIEGMVILEARIGEDGHVTKMRVRQSIPELDQAALDAIAQWEFTPTPLNGQTVAVVMTVTVSFSL